MKQNDKDGHGRLRELYAAYGADPGRWPEYERWRHPDLPPPELLAEENDARLIDRLLARHAVPPAPAQDHRQLIARAAAPAPPRSLGLPGRRHGAPMLMREWPAALALAASLAIGVWIGAAGIADGLLPSLLAGPVDSDTVALDPPDNLDFDSGGGT
jgi:hypothetical protein